LMISIIKLISDISIQFYISKNRFYNIKFAFLRHKVSVSTI
jgi:hypothetical protein